MHLSPSSIADYQECPHKYKRRHVDHAGEPPTIDGNLLRGTGGHAAIESFYSVPPEQRSLVTLLANFQLAIGERVLGYEKAVGDLIPPWSNEDVNKAHTQGTKALTLFWQTFGNEPDVPALPTEVRLERSIGSVDIHCVVDAVWEQSDRIILFEHKFPYSIPSISNYLVSSMQHNYCALALNSTKPTYVRYTICSQNRVERPYDLLIVPAALGEAYNTFMDVAIMVGSSFFTRHRGFHCARCPFFNDCEVALAVGDNNAH